MSPAAAALLGAVALALWTPAAHAQDGCDDLPEPSGYVVDEAGVVDDRVEQAISGRLSAFESSSGGSQVAALVVQSIGDEPIEDYANDLFDCWGVGAEGADTGVLVVIALEQRRLRIEVGRGVEDELTDVEAADIIRDVMTPRLRAGDHSAAISEGVDSIVQALGGELTTTPAPPPGGGSSGGGIALAAFVGFLVLSSLLGNARRRRGGFFPPVIIGGGGFGGGFGGGGGLGGGGFGGFGGGSSGGGGASGGW